MIAKKPEDRPASAAAVALAASALRRGDVAAAAAAVPAVATGVIGGDDTTQLLGTTGEDATNLLPAAVPVDEPEKRRRSPWTWPLIALIVLLLVVLGGTLWAVLANQDPEALPSTSATVSTPPPPSITPSVTPSQADTRVDVDALGLSGKTCDDAQDMLVAADLVANGCAEGNAAASDDQVGIVYAFDPRGRLDAGTPVNLTVYGPVTAIGAPPSAPRMSVGGVTATEIPAGSTAQLNWENFTCPSGTGTLSQYTVVVTNATFTADSSSERIFQPNERQADILVGENVGQNVSATYTATCDGGPRNSDPSPPMDVPIIAAEAGEETPPGDGADG
jgi:serine/threonine-protein kinase